MPRPSLILIAVGLAALLLAGGLSAWPLGSQTAALFGGVCFVGAVLLAIRRRDKYDLNELRRVHELEEIPEVEEDGEFASVICLCCHEPYRKELPLCPRCGRSQFH